MFNRERMNTHTNPKHARLRRIRLLEINADARAAPPAEELVLRLGVELVPRQAHPRVAVPGDVLAGHVCLD